MDWQDARREYEEKIKFEKELSNICKIDHPNENNLARAKELLEKPNVDPNNGEIRIQDPYFPPLFVVQSEKMFNLLISSGAKIDTTYTIHGNTTSALHHAHSKTIIACFAKKKADFSIKLEQYGSSQTPLQFQIYEHSKNLKWGNKHSQFDAVLKQSSESITAHVLAIHLKNPKANLENYVDFSDKMHSFAVDSCKKAWNEIRGLKEEKIPGTDYTYLDLLNNNYEIDTKTTKQLLPSLEARFPCYAPDIKEKLLTSSFYKKDIASHVTLSVQGVQLDVQSTEHVLSYLSLDQLKALHDSLQTESDNRLYQELYGQEASVSKAISQLDDKKNELINSIIVKYGKLPNNPSQEKLLNSEILKHKEKLEEIQMEKKEKSELLNKLKAEPGTSKNEKSESEGFDWEKTGAIRKKSAPNSETLILKEEKQLILESRSTVATSSIQLQNKPLDLPICQSKFFEEAKQTELNEKLEREKKQNELREIEEKQNKLKKELEMEKKNKAALDQKALEIEREREKATALREKEVKQRSKKEQRKQLEKKPLSYRR